MVEESLRVELNGLRRLLVLGVGNELEGDDGAGIELVRRLKRKWRSSRRLRAVEGGVAPENLILPLRDFAPSHILVVDSADMGLSPGSIRIVDKGEIAGFTISTHGFSLSLLVDYLEREVGAKVIVVGVQPFSVEVGQKISKPVLRALVSLMRMLSPVAL
jgi:hydrogenase 3 maturation protease